MIYSIPNLINQKPDYIETNEQDANKKLLENQIAYLNQEAYRFTIAKEIVIGNDTSWVDANLDNDTEESAYFVFNTMTGLHEKTNSFSDAKKRMEQIKQEFLVFSKLGSWTTIDAIPTKKISAPTKPATII